MIEEHDRVDLTVDIPEEGLVAGDVGTVLHVHRQGAAYEVEFMTHRGNTVAVTTVSADHLRLVDAEDVTHARPMARI